MQTLYIDIYFLINFSVDMLALYFASRLIGHRISIVRMLFCCVLLSLAACLHTLFFQGKFLGYIQLFLMYLVSVRICVKKKEMWKWIALSLSFVLFLFVIGGIVHWGYLTLDKMLVNLNIDTKDGAESKEALFFSVAILVCVLLLHLLISFLERKRAIECVRLSFVFLGKEYSFDALVDTGCFLREPLSNKAVVLLKKDCLSLSADFGIEGLLRDTDGQLRRRVRLVPVNTFGKKQMLVSFLIEGIEIQSGKKKVKMDMYLGLDEEGGSYGGYNALVPSFVLNYV